MKSRTTIYALLSVIFLAACLVGNYFFQRPASPEKIAREIGVNLQEELEEVEAQAAQLLAHSDPRELLVLPANENFAFYLIQGNSVIAWSDNKFIPSPASIADLNSLKLIKSGGSDYLARKWIKNDKQILVAVIPLFKRYPIINDYLKPEWNLDIFPAGNINIFEPGAVSGIPVCIEENCPFKIGFSEGELKVHGVAKIFTLVSALFFLVFLLGFLFGVIRKFKSPDLGLVVLAGTLAALRVLMTSSDFPGALLPGNLFNPQVFAASALNASLGDLLLNVLALLVVCIYLFKYLFHFSVVKYFHRNTFGNWILSILAGVFVLFAMLFPFVVIQTLYNNSTIVLDLSESLQFDDLRLVATAIILIAGLCCFFFAHTFIRLLIGDENKKRVSFSLLVAIVLFASLNHLSDQQYYSSLLFGLLYIVVVSLLKLYNSLKRLSFTTFTYLFVTILSISANGSFAIYQFSRDEKIDNQFRFARNFLIERDYFAEYLLRELSSKISNDAFIQTRVNTPFLSKDAVRQKIRQVFLSNYFNKYDVDIYIFNAAGDHISARSDINLSSLLDLYNKDSYRTAYEGIYYVSSPAADVTQKYLVVVPLLKSNVAAGHIVIELSLKKVIPENVYPELLVDNRFLQFYRSQEISYGVYVDNKLSYSSGSFNYEGLFNKAWFGNPALHTEGISRSGYDHIADEDELGKIAVVSSRVKSFTHILSNFSFFLVLGLVAILVFIFFHAMLNYWSGSKLYFSARIQLFLNLAFFLPLVIVSIMTLQVTTRSSLNQINDEYLSKTKKFSEQIATVLNNRNGLTLDRRVNFENRLTNLAQLGNLDANVYRPSGLLTATSQPLIFETNLFSNYINASALQKIRNGENLFIEDEYAGNLHYYTAYAAIKAPTTGELIGILGIPFFQSLYALEKVQINILANILNIFSLIFIALVVLSYVVTKWLTFPLTFITQSLRRTSLTKINQPLVWKTDDEIGLMVKEYNQMLFKLSESKVELEQTQRERAWREIAQQVAHEIKNPLTPMKLTLQQLERIIQSGNNVTDKMQKAIPSLLSQVNTLDEIASSFSSFAKMPEPVMKPLELIALLKRIIDLHSHSGQLLFESTVKVANIQGDDQLLGRTFSNIILNAFQAAVPGEAALVHIKVEERNDKAFIQFKDNGRGIEPDVAENIFIPHFTTKKSGSGLGLAIAKQGIEQMKGNIWFETTIGKGTTFFITFPLIK
ncbi:MAG TPA: HAMP domain-containing sensor histidine kinase [Ohtaekwangia sp.]|nr:HAMP domain-containing sensor histidine kinase [Ohtaekwangia sp.]